MSDIRIGAPGAGLSPDATAFAVSRDSEGILIGVRGNAAPQFAVSRDSEGLLLSAWPARHPAVTVEILGAMEGFVRSWATDWAAARAGPGDGAYYSGPGGFYPEVGVLVSGPNYYAYQAFWSFDTSVIPDGVTVTAVDLLTQAIEGPTGNFLLEARAHDWGDTLTTADFVAGDDLAGKTLLASLMAGDLSTVQLTALTSESAFTNAIDTAGYTRLMVSDKRQRIGPAPTSSEFVVLHYYLTGPARTRLSVTYEA